MHERAPQPEDTKVRNSYNSQAFVKSLTDPVAQTTYLQRTNELSSLSGGDQLTSTGYRNLGGGTGAGRDPLNGLTQHSDKQQFYNTGGVAQLNSQYNRAQAAPTHYYQPGEQ